MIKISDNHGRSFIIIMLSIAALAFFLRIGIEQIIKINIAQNESNAAGTLKLVSAALENYAKDKDGSFPEKLSLLTQTTPPYLDKDYIEQVPIKGYSYVCSMLTPSDYLCSAVPVKCNVTGKIIYTITTGGLLISEKCSNKE